LFGIRSATGSLTDTKLDSFRERAMDLTSAITGLDQAQTMSAVQISVAGKILDMQQFEGDAAVKLIQAADQTAGNAGDALVAAATGLGGKIDTYA